jgi:polysaccharide biosynthesis protein PelG
LNDLGAGMALLKEHAWAMRHLGVAVLLAVLAVWVDKWFFWFGPIGQKSTAGFLHYNVYDEVMFLAHLSIIPTFAGMFLLNDTEIGRAVESFRQTIRNHATYVTLSESVAALCSVVWSGIFRIVFVQTSVTIIVVSLLLLASGSSTFEIERFVLFLVAMAAVLFQAIGYLACTVLILTSRTRMLLVVQFLFLMMNICGSILFYTIFGPSAFAVLTSSSLFAILAVILGYRSLRSYGYFVFLGENDSLYTRN